MPGRRLHSLIGRRFGRLTVLCYTIGRGRPYWSCQCACGRTTTVRGDHLTSGTIVSCGCYGRDPDPYKPRFAKPARLPYQPLDYTLYQTWKNMKRRCTKQTDISYRNYGARGITVCERWLVGPDAYHNFAADMGPRPPGCTLDRIDNDAGYSPSNCRWATPSQQNLNRRTPHLSTS